MSGSPRTAAELGEYVRNHRCHNADPNVTIADWDRGVAAIEAEATPGESRTLAAINAERSVAQIRYDHAEDGNGDQRFWAGYVEGLGFAAALAEVPAIPDELGAAWAEAEAAMTVQYENIVGDPIDRKRYNLSVHRMYAERLDAEGNEEYEFEARATLPGIHYLAAEGPTPAAALRALAGRLSEPPQ